MSIFDIPTTKVDAMPEDWFRVLIHGPQGTGKTLLASTIAAAGKTLFIDLTGEKGVRSFRGTPYARNIEIIRPSSVKVMDDIFWRLNQGDHPYRAVVIDSLTAMQKMTMRFLTGQDETAVREIRQGTAPADIRTWGQSLDIMTDTATFWFGLADGDRAQPMHVIMTAQTKITVNEETDTVQRQPDVQKGALSITLATPDYILYTDVEDDVDNMDDDGSMGQRHIIRFGSDPAYKIKARLPHQLQGKMPPVLGREGRTNLIGLGRRLGVGGIPAAKKKTAASAADTAKASA